MKATLISPEGLISTADLPGEASQRLAKLQALIGGAVEVVYLDPPNIMLFDEMGKLKPHQMNPLATTLALEANAIQRDDYIAGQVIIVTMDALN